MTCQRSPSPSRGGCRERGDAYPRNDLLDFLLVRLHLEHTPDLHQINVFPITQAHDLVESTQQLKRLSLNLALLDALTQIRHHAGKEMQRIDVLEDVRRFVGDEEDVEIFERLVDITDLGGFDGGVLAVGGDEFRERGEEGFDSGSRHRVELTREDGCMERLSVVAKKRFESHLCRLWYISRLPTRPVHIVMKIRSRKKDSVLTIFCLIFGVLEGCSCAQRVSHIIT